MSKKSCVILFSSGLDSTVNLYKAATELDIKMAITINYGQKAYVNELERAKLICKELNITHKQVDIPWLSQIASSSLVSDKKIPTDLVDINSLEASKASAKSVWVCNRNGVFINLAASFAEELKADYVIVGFNLEEAQTFPDNSLDFINATNKSLSYSTQNQVEVKCYTTSLNKKEIVIMGKELSVNFDNIWPCYFSGDKICGKCESCQRYLAAQ